MQRIVKLRASGLPQFLSCGPSELNPEGFQEVFTENDAAGTGTLVHEFADRIVKTGEYDVAELRKRRADSLPRIETLISNFYKVWEEAQLTITKPQTEVFNEVVLYDTADLKIILTGHIDLCQIGPKQAIILDYKTGRLHDDHYHQIAGYAYLAWDRAGGPVAYRVDVAVVYLEDNSVTNYTFTAADLQKWAGEVVAKVGDTRYTVGKKCAFCKIQGSCPAYREYTQAAIKFFQSDKAQRGAVSWMDVAPEERGSLVDAMYVTQKGIERVKDSLKFVMASAKSGTSLDLGKGMEYTKIIREYEGLDTKKALPVLRERYDSKFIDNLVSITLADVLDLAASFVIPARKAKEKERLKKRLQSVGAIYTGKSSRFERRLKKENK